jgi:uncharacterized membrane protein HdeD (DUF308 family)
LRGCFDLVAAFAANVVSGWRVLLICGLIELGLGFWAAGSWYASVTVLVAWVAAAALVRGIGDIALGFHIYDGRRAVTGIKGLTERSGVIGDEFASAR